jgi:type IX secretion system PorP/SprF family membrane protein
MKKNIYLLIFLLTSLKMSTLSAQQRPQYTQYIFNNYLLNPALSGTENYVDAKIGHRLQWSGMQDAPRTSFVSAQWSLGSEYLWSNPLSLPDDSNDPKSRSYTKNYTASPAHHGMGVMAVVDKAGPISRVDAGLTYAYHLQVNSSSNLSVGVYGGFSRVALDVNAIKLEVDVDPALANVEQFTRPDLGLGVWYYGSRFFGGISAQQILPQRLAFTDNSIYKEGKSVPHMFATAGYLFFVDEEITAIPSFMVKRVENLPISVDFNAKFSFKDKFWLGGSYRSSDSFSAMAGFNIKNFVNLTYAYDLTTSALRAATSGTHEIVLGFQLKSAYQVFSGGRVWH